MTVYLTDYRTISTTNKELLDDIAFPQEVHWFPETYKNAASGLVYPPHKLASNVLLSDLCEDLRESAGEKCAFILAAGNTHFAGLNTKKTQPSRLTYDYRFLALTLNQIYAARVAEMVGAQDLVMTDASACASSLKVMTDVRNLIEHKGYSRVVVLSVEDQISNTVLQFFGETGAKGFNVGQGAVLAVFEGNRTRRTPLAILSGAGIASEKTSNSLAPQEDGAGYIAAIAEALSDAKMIPNDITVVKTHGTGTSANTLAECAAIDLVVPHARLVNFKQQIGHTLGASGLLETCLLLDSKPENEVILSVAAGMGNIYAAAIFNTKL